MPQDLLQQVYEANMRLPALGLVSLTWGNVSGVDRKRGIMVIKPSGVPYSVLEPGKMAVLDLEGNKIFGGKPSSDTATHLALYRRFPALGGIAHTHSRWATIWAQAGMPIPVLGTTHADCFRGAIPCTQPLNCEQSQGEYEKATGEALADLFTPEQAELLPAGLSAGHGPCAWGSSPEEAVDHALVLEEIAMMAWHTLALDPRAVLPQHILDKHFSRRHGKDAYYGQ